MNNSRSGVPTDFKKITDLIIRIAVLSLLLIFCYNILAPFAVIFIWAVVIMIALSPVFEVVVRLFRGRRLWATIFIGVLLFSFLVIPVFFLIKSLYQEIIDFKSFYDAGGNLIPPPGLETKNWPKIISPILEIWQLASENLTGLIVKYSDSFKTVSTWFLTSLLSLGTGIFLFLTSLLLAVGSLYYTNDLIAISQKIFLKLGGEKHGERYAKLTVDSVRNVIKGFFGVALIQAAMVAVGFYMTGVPFAGIWTCLCLILSIMQVGVGPLAIPISIYMFTITDTTTAILLAVWILFTVTIDNILKPLLMKNKKNPVPMPVLFVGSTGGFIYSGFVGLFLGAVILAVCYELFITWINTSADDL